MIHQKINHLAFSLLILSVICIISIPMYGQRSKSDIPDVTFKNRQFESDIPYGVPFFIKTPNRFDNKPANICALKIWYEGVSAKDTIYAYDWINKEENRTEFELKVREGLHLDRVYHFDFLYLIEEAYSPDQKILKTILYRVRQCFEYQRLAITGYDVDTIIKNIESELIRTQKYTNIYFGTKGQIILKQDTVGLFEFPITTSKGQVYSDDFALLAREQFILEEEQNRRKKALLKLKSNRNDYAVILKEVASSNPDFEEPLNRITKFVERGNYNSTSSLDIQKVLSISCSSECTKKLREIASVFTTLVEVERNSAEYSENIKYWEDKIGTLSEIVLAGVKISGLLSSEALITISDKATFDKVKIGTAFGGSFAFVNTNSINNISAPSTFGYFALKFYLKPVDKTLKNPYLSDTPILNRTSIVVGLKALGNLEYKGTQLENVFGTQPLIGVSYDIHRNFSIDIGAVLFRQSSVYPLVSGSSSPKAAFSIGLSIDPDLINRFRTLFTNEKFKIN